MINVEEEVRKGVLRVLITQTQSPGRWYVVLDSKEEVIVDFNSDGTFWVTVPDEGDGKVVGGRITVEIIKDD